MLSQENLVILFAGGLFVLLVVLMAPTASDPSSSPPEEEPLPSADGRPSLVSPWHRSTRVREVRPRFLELGAANDINWHVQKHAHYSEEVLSKKVY